MARQPARFVFIAGFEKCGTSALADHLVTEGVCSYLIDGCKESYLLSTAPEVSRKVMRSYTGPLTLLDASVDIITNPGALFSIRESAPDAKIIVLLRNQLERTISAYKFYRFINRKKIDDQIIRDVKERTGIEFGRSLSTNGYTVPAYLKRPLEQGHYFHSLLSELGGFKPFVRERMMQMDKVVGEFLNRSIAEQVLYESRCYRRSFHFPPLTILFNSFYSVAVGRLLHIIDPKNVMLVSSSQMRGDNPSAQVARFLNNSRSSHYQKEIETKNESEPSLLSDQDIGVVRKLVEGPFSSDTNSLLANVSRSKGVNVSLFDHTSLFS